MFFSLFFWSFFFFFLVSFFFFLLFVVTFIAGECIGFYTAFQNSAICISFDFELIHCNCQMLPLLFLF